MAFGPPPLPSPNSQSPIAAVQYTEEPRSPMTGSVTPQTVASRHPTVSIELGPISSTHDFVRRTDTESRGSIVMDDQADRQTAATTSVQTLQGPPSPAHTLRRRETLSSYQTARSHGTPSVPASTMASTTASATATLTASVSSSRRRRRNEPAGYYFNTHRPDSSDFEDKLYAQDAFKFCMIALLLAMYVGWTYAILL